MPGNNLFTLLAEFRAGALPGGPLSGAANPNIPDSEIVHRLRRAYVRIANEWNLSVIRETTLDLASGQALYLRPALRMGTEIQQVTIFRADGTPIKLTQLRPDQMRERFNLDSTAEDTGDPAYWAMSRKLLASGAVATQAGRLSVPSLMVEIRPVPTWTLTDGIMMEFPRTPQALFRLYQQTTVTADFYQDSNTVIVNGTPILVPGDEIGRIGTLNFDGTTAFSSGYKSMPMDFYQIQDYYPPTPTDTNIITNGDFASGITSWTGGTGVSGSGGKAVWASGYTGNSLYQVTASLAATPYQVQFTVNIPIGGQMTVTFGTATVATIGSTDSRDLTITRTVTPGLNATLTFLRSGAKNGVIYLDDVTAKAAPDSRILILDRPYEGEDALGARFVAAQVSDVEYAAPEGLEDAPVSFALADYFQSRDPDLADRHEARGIRTMERFMPKEADSEVERDLSASMPGLRIGRYAPYGAIPPWLR